MVLKTGAKIGSFLPKNHPSVDNLGTTRALSVQRLLSPDEKFPVPCSRFTIATMRT